jgi:protein phosphatase 2C family protein 2/3
MDQPEFKKSNFKEALRKTFFDLDEKVGKLDYGEEGCTSVVVFFNDTYIWCANAGDSRAVLSRTDKVQALSEDHKPDNQIETARIEKAGHKVEIERVDGSLALSRAIGDF